MRSTGFFHAFRAALLMSFILGGTVLGQTNAHIVRLAKLHIDPAHLDSYRAALKEEIEASVRGEPGVLSLEAVAVKDKPNEFTILEVYADAEAYKAHLESPHFKKYKSVTKDMVTSLELFECDPLILASKPSYKL